MISPLVRIKRGDVRKALRAMLKNAAGTSIDLAGCTVRFIMADLRGVTVVARETAVVDPINGTVLVVLEAADVANAGTYRAEFEVTYSDGRKETFPSGGYITIEILPDLG